MEKKSKNSLLKKIIVGLIIVIIGLGMVGSLIPTY
jgi:hypothetical protein